MPVPEWIKYVLSPTTCVATLVCWLVAVIYCVVKVSKLMSALFFNEMNMLNCYSDKMIVGLNFNSFMVFLCLDNVFVCTSFFVLTRPSACFLRTKTK